MARSRVAIEETHELPSRGLVYGDSIPDKVKMRAMTTMEEKQRLAGTGVTVIPDLIKSCCVEPKDLDVYSLKTFDINFLMYKLRVITYGTDYKVRLVCPECGHSFEAVINLDDVPVNPVSDDFKEPFEIGVLPISGDTLECRILSIRDYINIEKEARRIRNKFPDYVGDPEYILELKYRIAKVNGEELPAFKLQKYVEDMHARDLRFFEEGYLNVVNGIGLDTDMLEICPRCGEDVNFMLPVNDEFFRPTYSNGKR